MRASAPANRICDKPRQARRWRTTARPLAIQRLAAGLVAITHGLDRAHIGAICDALTAAGIDPDVWSARAVNDALNADMRARSSSWPDQIANPGAFLHSRLRRLSWSPPEAPTQAGGSAAGSIDQAPPPVVLTEESRAVIAARQEEIRQILTSRSQRTRSEHTHRTVSDTAMACRWRHGTDARGVHRWPPGRRRA